MLRSPTQVRNAVRYVLRNGDEHGVHFAVRHGDPRPCPDPLSSAAWYGCWKEDELNVRATQSAATVVRPALCYLLREGLRRVERLSLLDAPPARETVGMKGARRSKGRAELLTLSDAPDGGARGLEGAATRSSVERRPNTDAAGLRAASG